MNKLSKFTFKNGQDIRYKIIWKQPAKSQRADGLCDNPDQPKPKILVDPDLNDKRFMEVICEEVFHAFAYEKNEKTARRFAATLKKLFYKLGWKRN